MLLPIAVGLGGLALYRSTRPSLYGVLTESRRALFLEALSKSDPPLTVEQLRLIADTFEEQGLKKLAEILRKRAALRSLPPDKKAYRAQVYKTLMSIKDPVKAGIIRQAADAFDADSAYGQAATLRDYASGLEAQANMAKIAAVTAPPQASASAPTVSGEGINTEKEDSPFTEIVKRKEDEKPFETLGQTEAVFTDNASLSPDNKDFE